MPLGRTGHPNGPCLSFPSYQQRISAFPGCHQAQTSTSQGQDQAPRRQQLMWAAPRKRDLRNCLPKEPSDRQGHHGVE